MTANDELDLSIEEIVTISKITTDRTWKITDFSYEDIYVLTYVTGGNATCNCNGETIEIGQGDMLFYPSKQVRTTYSSPNSPWNFIVVKFKLNCSNDYTRKMLSLSPVRLGNDRGRLEAQYLKLEAIWRSKRPSYLIQCKSIILDLLSQLLFLSDNPQESKLYENHIKPVLDAIEADISKNYSVKEMAEISGLSPSYFRAVFQNYTGYSPVQYKNYVKASYAKDLLQTGLYTVTEVSDMVGLSNYYFSRLFKKIFGSSPSTI